MVMTEVMDPYLARRLFNQHTIYGGCRRSLKPQPHLFSRQKQYTKIIYIDLHNNLSFPAIYRAGFLKTGQGCGC